MCFGDITRTPQGISKKIRIGAGASGLELITTLPNHVDNCGIIFFEKSSESQGTWRENQYPGS
jgi:cation diffusion facilitator CzcD-associated flavoprotein CzcO